MKYQLNAEVRSVTTDWQPYMALVRRAPFAPTTAIATEVIRRDTAYAFGVSELEIEVRRVTIKLQEGDV